jgi:hypothetical protein
MDDALPVFDLAPLVRLLEQRASSSSSPSQALDAAALDADPETAALCRGVADSLARTSCLLVRDPRVPPAASAAFMDALEGYFARPEADKLRDCRPHLHYQVGATPPGVETPRCVTDPASCAGALAAQPDGHRATPPTGADAKWRFFWRLGARPAETDFPELNAEPVVPSGCEAWWPALLDGWGAMLLAAAEAAAVAAAHGLGLDGGPGALAALMRAGPHLLAPTGSDLSPAAGLRPGAVLAGFHQDLNLLTIHSQARYPGLFAWTRGGGGGGGGGGAPPRRLAVRVPEGCLLLQAGKQLEHLTGGRVRAGWHEVLATPEALELARQRLLSSREEEEEEEQEEEVGGGQGGAEERRRRRRPAGARGWRVSSTVFAHVASDQTLEPLLPFAEAARVGAAAAAGTQGGGKENAAVGGGEAAAEDGGGGDDEEAAWRRRYAPVKAGAQVQAELEAIKLAAAG